MGAGGVLTKRKSKAFALPELPFWRFLIPGFLGPAPVLALGDRVPPETRTVASAFLKV